MWLDDDGDDDPLGGFLPDPSTRHWRHPSEVGAQNAQNPADGVGNAAYPTTPSTNSRPWHWPAGAIGGGLVVVAIGVFGLSLTDGTGPEILSTGSLPVHTSSAAVIRPAMAETARQDPRTKQEANSSTAASSQTSTTLAAGPSKEPSSKSAPPTTVLAAPATTLLPLPTEAGPERGGPPTTDPTTGRAADGWPDLETIDPDALGEGLLGSEQLLPLMVPAPGLVSPFGAGVYDNTDATNQLASFVAVEGHILTSAAALGGRDRVYLLIDQMWIGATVVATDPATDVAVLTVEPEIWEIGLPIAVTIPTPVELGTDVFVGYCPTELVIGTTTTTAPTLSGTPGDVAADEVAEPPQEERFAPAIDCPVRQNRPLVPSPPSNQHGGSDSGDNPPNKHEAQPKPTDDDIRERLARRLGTIWSTARSVERIETDHNVYDPIKTVVPSSAGMAGSALRDLFGHVVGLVMSAENPSVAALPIDRAVAVADALVTTGAGSATWLGIDGVDDPAGVLVTAIDDNSPAAAILERGDLIIAIDGTRIPDVDYLMHRIRQAGDEDTADLTVKRSDAIHVFAVPMAKTPALERQQ